MTAPTREQVLEWARDAGAAGWWSGERDNNIPGGKWLERIAAIAYAAGQDSKRRELQTEMQRLTELAQTAEKWRGIAVSRDGSGRTVQKLEQEAYTAAQEEFARTLDDWHMHDAAEAIRARSKP